jgi:uncharacterized protein
MSGIYSIPVYGLKEQQYTFDFEIGKEFFELFEDSEISEGNLAITVKADKRSSHIDLNIKVEGVVLVPCDRCLALFSLPLEGSYRLLVKFGRELDDSDPEIITLPADEQVLEMSQFFYEYILLALPIQKIHPEDRNGKSLCDPEMIKKLEEHLISEIDETDPRWNELKKLMNN